MVTMPCQGRAITTIVYIIFFIIIFDNYFEKQNKTYKIKFLSTLKKKVNSYFLYMYYIHVQIHGNRHVNITVESLLFFLL